MEAPGVQVLLAGSYRLSRRRDRARRTRERASRDHEAAADDAGRRAESSRRHRGASGPAIGDRVVNLQRVGDADPAVGHDAAAGHVHLAVDDADAGERANQRRRRSDAPRIRRRIVDAQARNETALADALIEAVDIQPAVDRGNRRTALRIRVGSHRRPRIRAQDAGIGAEERRTCRVGARRSRGRRAAGGVHKVQRPRDRGAGAVARDRVGGMRVAVSDEVASGDRDDRGRAGQP